MFQQYKKQQTAKLNTKTEEVLAASFVMPAIRTMADDLAEANNPTSISVPISVPTSTAKVTNAPIVNEKVSFDRSFNKVAAPPPLPSPQRPIVNNIVRTTVKQELKKNVVLVPNQPTTNNNRSVGVSVFVGVFISLILSVMAWVGWTYWPRNSATIADKIPSETLAFISFHQGAGVGEKILPKILEKFKVSENSLGSQWSDLVYGILPGSTSSETIPFLLLTSKENINVSGTEMTAKKLANGTTMIVANTEAGRLNGLNGKALGENSEYKSLLSQVPQSAEYLYIKQRQLASIVKTFTYLSPSTDYSVLISLASGGENTLAISGVKSSGSEWTKKQVAWEKLIKSIPTEIISATGGINLSKSFDDWRIAQSNDPKMQELLNSLNEQGSVLEKIRADLTGTYVAGGLSSDNLLPDGVAVVEIKDGATNDLKEQMTLMEKTLTKLGSMIGGASYADAVFADNNYKEAPIRFVNFGDSSHSFDYAIVDSMLFVSNSKNSMQKLIDVYRGEGNNLASVIGGNGKMQANWQYALFSPDTLAKLPASLETLFSGFTSVYIEPTGTKTFSGSIGF